MSKKLVNGDVLKKYHSLVNEPSLSPTIKNVEKPNFKVGTGVIEDTHTKVDYTNLMERCIITVDSLIGHTEKVMGGLADMAIQSLVTVGTNPINFFISENARIVSSNPSNLGGSINANNVYVPATSNQNGKITVEVTGFSTGKPYILVCDDPTGGTKTCIETHSTIPFTYKYAYNYEKSNESSRNIGFITKYDSIQISFYSSLTTSDNKSVTYPNIRIYEVKEYEVFDMPLRSLPNGSYDKYDNGLKTTNVLKHRFNGLEGWKLSDSSNSRTNTFTCVLPNMIGEYMNSEIALRCNKYPVTSFRDKIDDTSLYVDVDRNEICFRVGKWCQDADTLKNHLAVNEPDIEVWYGCKAQEEIIYPSILCDPGDTVFITSPIDLFDFKHNVVFNTKSQISNSQNSLRNVRRSLFDKVKGLFDGEFHINEDGGFLRFPTVLGGILVQYGTVVAPIPDHETHGSTRINFPRPFKKPPIAFCSPASNSYGGYSEHNASAISDNVANVYIHFSDINGTARTGSKVRVNWLAIGK